MITLTPGALHELKRLAESDGLGTQLRFRVEAGGCSGLQYQMDFEPGAPREDDHVLEQEGLRLLVDPKSLPHIDGLTVDFSKALIGGGFKFVNPKATQSCSCGQSFAT